MSTAVAEQLLTQLRSLVPLGTQTPSDANIKSAQDVLRKLKVAQQSGQHGKGGKVAAVQCSAGSDGDGDSGAATPSSFSLNLPIRRIFPLLAPMLIALSSCSALSIASLLPSLSWSL